MEGLISEIMGRETGVCGGRGGSQHLCKNGFYSNGIQGGTVPVATGMALAEKLKGNHAIGAVFLGDGTLGEGAVYESMNIASKHQLPLLLIIENNCIRNLLRSRKHLPEPLMVERKPLAYATPIHLPGIWRS